MDLRTRWIAAAALLAALAVTSCTPVTEVRANAPATKADASPPRDAGPGQIRATGTIQAVRAITVQTPHIAGQQSRLVLIDLVPNGTSVKEGDVLAEFDRTAQTDAAREAQAKYDDLAHQVKQKEAQNRSDHEKRLAEVKQAEADLAKAEIQLRKGPILSEIDRLKNEVRAAAAKEQVASLRKSDAHRIEAEAAALKILQLQMERQKVALDRAVNNSERLVMKARFAGMVALENVWRGGSMGQAQAGDQLWPGQPLLKIFDPGMMLVRTQVGEPDGSVLRPGATATVYLDAYPDAVFKAKFDSASPVATSALGSPIKNFSAVFVLDRPDPRLLPDLSAAVIIDREVQKP